MKLSEKIPKNYRWDTPYTRIAKELGVSAKFVGMIARGERVPQRGKGMLVIEKLEALVAEQEEV